VIKFVSDLRQVGGILGTPVSSTNKTDITEILSKVVINTMTLTITHVIHILILGGGVAGGMFLPGVRFFHM